MFYFRWRRNQRKQKKRKKAIIYRRPSLEISSYARSQDTHVSCVRHHLVSFKQTDPLKPLPYTLSAQFTRTTRKYIYMCVLKQLSKSCFRPREDIVQHDKVLTAKIRVAYDI